MVVFYVLITLGSCESQCTGQVIEINGNKLKETVVTLAGATTDVSSWPILLCHRVLS